jgi:hypothetical protein
VGDVAGVDAPFLARGDAMVTVALYPTPSAPLPRPLQWQDRRRRALLVSGGKLTNLANFTKPVDTVVVGADPAITEAGLYPMSKRLASLGDDRATWKAVMADRRYAILDQFLGSTGGPATVAYKAGDTLTPIHPATCKASQRRLTCPRRGGLLVRRGCRCHARSFRPRRVRWQQRPHPRDLSVLFRSWIHTR